MKKSIIALVTICSAIVALGMGAPARAEMGKNTIGPSVDIGGGTTTFGIDSKFAVSDNISVRPFVYFPSGGTVFGSGLTYDFNLTNTGNKVQITPFLGGAVSVGTSNASSVNTTVVSFVGGADFDVTDSVQLRAALDVPLSSGYTSGVTLGAGFRF
jgi:hypothetical protein